MRTDCAPWPSRVRWFAGLTAAILMVLPLVVVEALDASLDVQVAEQAFTVGDSISVRVLARGGQDLLWGELTARIGNDDAWAVTGGPHEIPGSSPPAWEVTLVPLKVGELDLPAFEAGVRVQGSEPESVTAEAVVKVTVASVLGPEDAGEPAPLKGPLGVQGFPWEWVLPIAVVILPIIGLLIWWWRRRGAGEGGAAVTRLAPIEELRQLLQDLGTRIGREPTEVVCDRLASGVRNYLERRTGEPAAEMTSHELQVLARRAGWPGEVQGALLKVTRVADGARFGRVPTGDGELDATRELTLHLGRSLEEFLTPSETSDEEVA